MKNKDERRNSYIVQRKRKWMWVWMGMGVRVCKRQSNGEMANNCTLFKLAFISCVFRNPNTLDSIPMKHELTNTFTSKLITTLDVGDFNLYIWSKIQLFSLPNLYKIHFVTLFINGNWKPIKFTQYWLSTIHTYDYASSHIFFSLAFSLTHRIGSADVASKYRP